MNASTRPVVSNARPLDTYLPLSPLSEEDLFRSHRSTPVARLCACGDVVIADPLDPGDGVREHQSEPKHLAWRAWFEL